MKCPGCGCNFMDDEKFCPMCEMRNNALTRAAHNLRRQKHTETFQDCGTVTCAHPEENTMEALRHWAEQRTTQSSSSFNKPRSAKSTSRPAVSSASSGKRQKSSLSRALKIVLGIFIALNFGLPLLFALLEWFLYGIF